MNKSGISSQVISHPKGGGALTAIGETFSPDLFTGSANLTVPIAVLPGRNGFQPELALAYSSGQGDGLFGLGWSLNLPSISRDTRKGFPTYDGTDDFLAGSEQLVAVRHATGRTSFRPRTEGTFSKIERLQGGDDNYWLVRSRDGLSSLYGTPGGSPDDPAVIRNPSDHSQIFSWHISRTTDQFGNVIAYEYERDEQIGAGEPWDSLQLKSVRYCNFGPADDENFLISIDFAYQDRPIPLSNRRAGFQLRTRKRCTGVEIATHSDIKRIWRRYKFKYVDEEATAEFDSGASLLRSISVEGVDGDKVQAMPPIDFDYSRFEPRQRQYIGMAGANGALPPRSLAHPDFELADVIGDGLPDIIQIGDTNRYWRNVGGGKFDVPRPLNHLPHGLRLGDAGVFLADANGDGRIDLVCSSQSLNGFVPVSADSDGNAFIRQVSPIPFLLEDPEVRLIDLDGNGVPDALRTGTAFQLAFQDGEEGWTRSESRERHQSESFPDVRFSDPRVKLADMTGDGIQDIVFVDRGSVSYWPNLGNGRWGQRVAMSGHFSVSDAATSSPFGFDPRRLLMGDIDGDGVSDLVYVESGRLTVWLNQCGHGWSAPIRISGTPLFSNFDSVRLADMMGTGTAGILWTYDFDDVADSNYKFLDLTGGHKPYLLVNRTNNCGAQTRVEYASSCRFAVEDHVTPETRWRGSLPFPVQVVSKVSVTDAFSGNVHVSQFAYHQGHWDAEDREFRGFGLVEQWDTETFARYIAGSSSGSSPHRIETDVYSPPTLTRTWFHQGEGSKIGGLRSERVITGSWAGDVNHLPPTLREGLTSVRVAAVQYAQSDRIRLALRALRGKSLRSELFALDGTPLADRPYTVTEALWDVKEIESETGARTYFPHQRASRTTRWERGSDPMTAYKFAVSHNDYGLLESELAVAVPRGRDPLTPSSSEQSFISILNVNDYARRDDENSYIVDRAARNRQFEFQGGTNLGLLDFVEAAIADSLPKNLISEACHYYDGEAFVGLPLGQMGNFGALSRTETLAFTSEFLEQTFDTSDSRSVWDGPAYLTSNPPAAWTDGYPDEFVDRVGSFAGYVVGAPRPNGELPYYIVQSRAKYDFQDSPGTGLETRGLVLEALDSQGGNVRVTYDPQRFLPVTVTDAVGLVTTAEYDPRTLQARRVVDPNGNITDFSFSPLGYLTEQWMRGANGEGDHGAPSMRCDYDLLAFFEREQPISVQTVRRMFHDSDSSQPGASDRLVRSAEYSDGFGRLLQSRSQAEGPVLGDETFGGSNLALDPSAPRMPAMINPSAEDTVVVSGWQIYDNKGRTIQRYEPFFSQGWDYSAPLVQECGQSARYYYDACGQQIRSVSPDGSEQRSILGVPHSLDDPDNFEPTPWEAYSYDANDNAGRTHPAAAFSYSDHWNTPASAEVDALGRTVRSVIRNGPDQNQWFETRSTFDIAGNLVRVVDALGRVSFQHVYDLVGRKWRTDGLDSGRNDASLDPNGNAIEERDSKGAATLHLHDILGRPTRLWARDRPDTPLTLRQRFEYGDEGSIEQDAAERQAAADKNLLGHLVRTYDEAGLSVVNAVDFKGNVLDHSRRMISDSLLINAIENGASSNWEIDPYVVDWTVTNGTALSERENELLESRVYQTNSRYDALNHVIEVIAPEDVEGQRRTFTTSYNSAGRLDQLFLDGEEFVHRIAHDAKGHRTVIAYGNGIMTRYAYDPTTFRLVRLVSEPFISDGTSFTPQGLPLQNLTYGYDLAGNLRSIEDRTPRSGILNNPDAAAASPALASLLASGDALIRRFSYDPVYRLISASGRECDRPPTGPIWTDSPRCSDLSRARPYTEAYRYDAMGNMVELRHRSAHEDFVRRIDVNSADNRHTALRSGADETHYDYDAAGNVLNEGAGRHFAWNAFDRVKAFRVQTAGAEPSVYAQYLYDVAGQRLKKIVRKQGGQVEVTHYVGGFEHRKWGGPNANENNVLHVMDDASRVALVRIGPEQGATAMPAVQFQLGDHLGSSNVVLSNSGDVLNREEFTPYGETSFGSSERKRFRFTGMERDEESGLTYHGARYYCAPLGRWLSVDPEQAQFLCLNPYNYVRCNPLSFSDRSGRQPDPPDLDAVEADLQARARSWRTAVDNVDRKVGETLKKFGEARDKLLELEAFKKWGRWQAQKEVSKLNKELSDLFDEIHRLNTRGQQIEEEAYKKLPNNNTYRGAQGASASSKAIRKDVVQGLQVLESRLHLEPTGDLMVRANSVGWRNLTLVGGVVWKGVGWTLVVFGAAANLEYIINSDNKFGATFNVALDYAIGYGEYYTFSRLAASRVIGGAATMLLGLCGDQAGACEQQERYKRINEFIFKEYPGVVTRSRYEFIWSSWLHTEWVYSVQDNQTYTEIYDAVLNAK